MIWLCFMSEEVKRDFHVAVLIESNREYARGLLKGVNRFVLERGNWTIFFEVRDLEAPLPRWLASWKGDGVLARINDRASLRVMRKLGIPVLDLRGAVADAGVPFIGVNNEMVVHRVVEHLRSLGLSHFAFYARPRGENRFQDQRCDFFVRDVRAVGHGCDVFEFRQESGTPVDWDAWHAATIKWLRSLPKPVGIMAPHDPFGHQLLVACREAGIDVPGEVAVASVDNDALICNMGRPTMTSLDVGSEQIGYKAARTLEQMMRGRTLNTQEGAVEIDPGEIIPRESTRVIGTADLVSRQALAFIRDNAHKGISARDVLAHVGASQRGLERKIRAAVGRTPNQEIVRVRTTLAKQLLATTDLPLQAVCERCGFGSYKYFSDAFLKSTGQRPSDFRSKGRRDDGGAE